MARILVIDDEKDIRSALRTLLEDVGHDVIEGEDGLDLPARVISENPELVLLDVMMPNVDGFEALRRLKANPATQDVPVVIVTAKPGPNEITKARDLGAFDFIFKPWAEGEVESRVEWAIKSLRRNNRLRAQSAISNASQTSLGEDAHWKLAG